MNSAPTFDSPRVRLSPPQLPQGERQWDRPLPTEGRWKVTGAAGSGVSSFLVDTVAAKIRAGADPDGVLFLAPSKEAATRLRMALHRTLASGGEEFASLDPLTQSIHSLAFGLLRTYGDDKARLISGAEQDGVIRELLAGHVEEARGPWSADIRPALPLLGFARQLRDLLLRAVERGQGPDELIALGREFNRPLWSSAGEFLKEYQQVMRLSGAHSYSASELTSLALQLDVPRRWHTVVVDDAQHLDPMAAALIEKIMPGQGGPAIAGKPDKGLVVIGGDLEQSVFHFRGATGDFLKNFEPVGGDTIDLGSTRRRPATSLAIADAQPAEGVVVADFLRRARLESEVRYSDMAVVVRSAAQLGAARRALLSAGIPVHVKPTDEVLADQHVVSAVLLGVRALETELKPYDLETLVLGPVGGADPVTLRRLVRALRRYNPERRGVETLASLLAPGAEIPDFGDLLTEREHAILNRLLTVLNAGRAAVDDGAGVEETLWAVWQATGLAEHLSAVALRGGAAGSQADRDLDAMMSLFDLAGDFVERHPGSASVSSFLEHVLAQELPTGVRDRRTQLPDAVRLLTAHGSVGREFSVVVVMGVYEDIWPSLGETGSLFQQEDLLDFLDRGIEPDVPVSHAAERLAEERRLFHVACSRATEQLLITSADNLDSAEPVEVSRFIHEFTSRTGIDAERVHVDVGVDELEESTGIRLLTPSSLVAELRRTLVDDTATADARRQAARQLARLAQAGVEGADPSEWWSNTEPSTAEPLHNTHRLSPSRIEELLACPLKAVVGRMVEESSPQMLQGTIAHAYFEAIGEGVDEELAKLYALDTFRQIQNDPAWRSHNEVERFTRLLERSKEWYDSTRTEFEGVGSEVDVNVLIDDDVRIVGRMDRLEKSRESDDLHVIDLKTGKSPVSKDEAAHNPQLFAYQLALSKGEVQDGKVVTRRSSQDPLQVGGGVLVYPASPNKKLTTREQVAKSAEELEEFSQAVTAVAKEASGPELRATKNTGCTYCRIRLICPIQSEGKRVIDA